MKLRENFKFNMNVMIVLLFSTFALTGCSSMGGLFGSAGASYSFEKTGNDIRVDVADTQEIKNIDASAKPIVLKDGTVICCEVSIKKNQVVSPPNDTSKNLSKMLELILSRLPDRKDGS